MHIISLILRSYVFHPNPSTNMRSYLVNLHAITGAAATRHSRKIGIVFFMLTERYRGGHTYILCGVTV